MVGTRTVLQPPWAQQPHPQSPLLLPGAKQQLHPRHPGPAGGEVRDEALGDPGDHPPALAVPQGGRAHLGPAPAQARSALGPVSGTCRHPAPRQVPPAAAGPVLEVRGCATQPSCPTAPLCGCSSALSYSSPSAPSWHHKFNRLWADPGQPNKAAHVFLATEQLRAGEGRGCWGFPPRLPHYPPRGVGMLPASRSPAPTAQGGSWVPGGCCSPIKTDLVKIQGNS